MIVVRHMPIPSSREGVYQALWTPKKLLGNQGTKTSRGTRFIAREFGHGCFTGNSMPPMRRTSMKGGNLGCRTRRQIATEGDTPVIQMLGTDRKEENLGIRVRGAGMRGSTRGNDLSMSVFSDLIGSQGSLDLMSERAYSGCVSMTVWKINLYSDS